MGAGALDEYELVDSRKPSIRISRRNGETLETGPACVAGNVGRDSLALIDIYEDVNFARSQRER